MANKKNVSIFVSVLVSCGLLALLFSAVPFRELVKTLRSIHIPGVLLYLGLSLAATFFKAARSKWLLSPVRISWPDMFLVTFVRNGFEDLLPVRLGSLSYVVALNNNLGCPFEAAASTLLIMLVFDFLTLSPFVLAALLLAPAAANILPFPLLIGFSVAYFLAVFALAWKIVPVTRLVVGWIRRAFRVFGGERHPKAGRAFEKLDETVAALSALKSRPIAVPLFLVSSAIRFLKYLSLYALLLAILHSRGIGAAELALWKIILAVTAAELTSTLPVKGIADFGTWESAWVLAFALMGIDRATAVLSGFSLHVVTNLFEYGFAALALFGLSFRRKKPPNSSPL